MLKTIDKHISPFNIEDLLDSDRHYWEAPSRYALLRDIEMGDIFYIIFSSRSGKPMMLMHDDFAYNKVLTKKMIEHNVKIFDTMKEIQAWALEV